MKLPAVSFIDLLATVVLCCFVVAGPHDVFLGDPGLGWHLKSGELMVMARSAISIEPFLFTQLGSTWVHNQWLSDVVLWVLWSIGGLPLLVVVGTALCLAPYLLLIPEGSSFKLKIATASIFLLTVASGSIQWLVRPVVFSFLGFALLLRWIRWFSNEGHPRIGSSIVALVALFWLWANLHPGFLVGLLVLALFGISLVAKHFVTRTLEVGREETVAKVRRQGIVLSLGFVAAIVATLATPYGFGLYADAITLARSPLFMSLNREWLPPEWSASGNAPFFICVVLVAVSMLRSGWRKLDLFSLLGVTVLGLLAMSQRRYIPYFTLFSITPLLMLFANCVQMKASRGLPQVWLTATVAAALSLSACANSLGLFGTFRPFGELGETQLSRMHPAEAVAAIRARPVTVERAERIFNSSDWGGFLIWTLWPTVQIYIDDRNTQNGESAYREFEQIWHTLPGWDQALSKIEPDWVLIEADAPLVEALRMNSAWEQVLFRQSPASFVLFRRRT